jgi:hypothetical protein
MLVGESCTICEVDLFGIGHKGSSTQMVKGEALFVRCGVRRDYGDAFTIAGPVRMPSFDSISHRPDLQ